MRDTELAEVAAFRDLEHGFPAPGAFRRAGDALAIRFPGGPREFNRIVGLETLEQLDELEPFFERGPFVVSLDPATGLEPALLERGFTHAYPWQKFVREPAQVPGPLPLLLLGLLPLLAMSSSPCCRSVDRWTSWSFRRSRVGRADISLHRPGAICRKSRWCSRPA